MKKKPKISIIIPYYKKREYIQKTLNSVFAQTYKNFEVLLIYDDKNLEDYFFIKRNFVKKKLRKKIRIILNKKNLGAGYSRNIGIKFSRGDYVAFLDADDIWHKTKLINQLTFMEKNSFKFTHTSYKIINYKNNIQIRIAKELDYNQIIKSCDIGLSTVMVCREILKNKFFPSLKTKEDYVMWLKIMNSGIKIHPLKKILATWRETKNSLSSNTIQKLIDGYIVYRVYLKCNHLVSFINLIRLSVNYIIKKLINA